MSAHLESLSQVPLWELQDDWEKFEGQATRFEVWPVTALNAVPGGPFTFAQGRREGEFEIKSDGLRSLRFIGKKSEHDAGDHDLTYGCIDERKLPDGSNVATFTVCGEQSGWQWQKEIDSSGAYCPIIKQRMLATASVYKHDGDALTSDSHITTSGPAFIPVLYDSSLINQEMWRPATDSAQVAGAEEHPTCFRVNDNGRKTGWISRVSTGGTKGEWQDSTGSLGGAWRDYKDVGPDGSEISCTVETHVKNQQGPTSSGTITLQEKTTLHKQYTAQGLVSDGYFHWSEHSV